MEMLSGEYEARDAEGVCVPFLVQRGGSPMFGMLLFVIVIIVVGAWLSA